MSVYGVDQQISAVNEISSELELRGIMVDPTTLLDVLNQSSFRISESEAEDYTVMHAFEFMVEHNAR